MLGRSVPTSDKSLMNKLRCHCWVATKLPETCIQNTITVGDMVLPKSLPTHNHNYLHSTLGVNSINHDTNQLGIECYLMI